jgi:hypothetical protein
MTMSGLSDHHMRMIRHEMQQRARRDMIFGIIFWTAIAALALCLVIP